jgi:hypothetical protein
LPALNKTLTAGAKASAFFALSLQILCREQRVELCWRFAGDSALSDA